MNNAIRIFAATLCLAVGSPFVNAAETDLHLYDAAKADPALAGEFKRIMAPIAKQSSWVQSYGTTSPLVIDSLDEKKYQIFSGCKPHDCITESYVVMYDQQAKRITAGAFVRNTFSGPDLKKSAITWLGKGDLDAARVLGKYLY